MLIILEGCDGVGKTTLADALAEQTTDAGDITRVKHYGPPQRHPLYEYELDVLDYEPGTGQSFIADRYHLGELVYAPLYRDEPSKIGGASGAVRAHIELFLAARGAVIVHVDGHEHDVRDRLSKRGEDFLDFAHIPTVLHEFRKAVATSLCTVVRVPMWWDASDVNRILMAAGAAEKMAASSWTPGFVGARPRVLVVGAGETGLQVPFMPFEGSVGHAVMDTMGYRWNAQAGFCDVNQSDIHRLYAQFRSSVVAVGYAAHRRLVYANVAHGAVPLPSTYTHLNYFSQDLRLAARGKQFV